MTAHADIQEGLGEAFDVLAAEFFDEFTDIVLLKPSATTSQFVVVDTITSKWFFEYSDFRQNFLLQIAEGVDLADSIADATHVKVEDDVYVIRRGDTLAPRGTDVTWKLFCDRFTKRAQAAPLY